MCQFLKREASQGRADPASETTCKFSSSGQAAAQKACPQKTMQALGAQTPCRCLAPQPLLHSFFVRPGQAALPAVQPNVARRRSRRQAAAAAVAAPAKPFELAPFEAWNTGAAIKKRTDIKTIMILGAGPIVIGQVS